MSDPVDTDGILKALQGEHRLSLNQKVFAGYIALMVAATALGLKTVHTSPIVINVPIGADPRC